MALHDLVDYFNNRFEHEHHANYRPLTVENDRVHGFFGQLRISSIFSPIREKNRLETITGQAVKIKVDAVESLHLHSYEIENLTANAKIADSQFESVINFDRLARTVHMLNYLPQANENTQLFLEVDPRHILGVKQDHGAYFESVIAQCGLATKNTIIVLAITRHYVTYNEALIRGLKNYRQRHYKIALRFDYLVSEKHAFELISKLSPDYVSLSARQMEMESGESALKKLQTLKNVMNATQSLGILRQVDRRKSEILAESSGFDFVEGRYYEHKLVDSKHVNGF